MKKNLIFVLLTVAISSSCIYSTQTTEAGKKTNDDLKETLYFSIAIPDSWIYEGYSATYAADMMGYGIINAISLYPNTFDDEEIQIDKSGVLVIVQQDQRYSIKNAPLETYVKKKISIGQENNANFTSQEKIIVDGEEAIKVYSESVGEHTGLKYIEYFMMYNDLPYHIMYQSDQENYDKYLPEFEQMVKTFKFRD